MPYAPEMELIDQLCGSDMPLPLMINLFPMLDQAGVAIAHYVERDIVLMFANGDPLPKWMALALLRDASASELQEGNFVLSVTERSATAFQAGGWERV